jgi:diguanylate cyclase (GGDEF)-like protein/PAS domain S-box-containing protein
MFFLAGIWGFNREQGFFYNGIEFEHHDLHMLFQYMLALSVGAMSVAYLSKTRKTLAQALMKSHTETFVFDKQSLHFEMINESARNNLGFINSDWARKTFLDIQTHEGKEVIRMIIDELKMHPNDIRVYKAWHQRLNGSTYPVEVRLQQIEQSGHEFLMATVNDITDRIQSQFYKELGDDVCQHTEQAVLICDENSNIIRVNPAFTRITGYSEEEVKGLTPKILNSGKHDKTFFTELFEYINLHGKWHGELYNRHKSGQLYLIEMSIKKIVNEVSQVTYYISIFNDITEERDKSIKLKHRAEHDVLTSLPNRKRLYDEYELAVAMAKRQENKLAVLFLDLNGFKPINDNYSHQVGDRVLQEIALRLGNAVRETDIVARIGGDEFVILMTNIEDETVVPAFIRKLKSSVAQPIQLDPLTLSLSVSVGTAFYPKQGRTLDDLISIADQAMYFDKQSQKS